jgi:hypothetical protein
MSTVSFTVAGQPVPQPRPRVSTAGGFARAVCFVDQREMLSVWQ